MSAVPLRGRTRWGRPASLALLCACATLTARADMVMLSQTTLVSGSSSTVEPLTIDTPGKLTVELSNIDWPQQLTSLDFMLSSSSRVLAYWSSPSSTVETIDLLPGSYFGRVTGTAGGPLGIGVFSLQMNFQPAGTVPLPASAGLLLAGLLGMAGLAFAWQLRSANPRGNDASRLPIPS